MKIHVDMTPRSTTTTRRADGPNASPNKLTIRRLRPEPDENGNYEMEVTGPRAHVLAWLKRNGYGEGEYTVKEV